MRIRSLKINNFRCINECELNCQYLTALVGPNGAGKSTFLRALKVFFDDSADYDIHDFYNSNTAQPILISVTFTDLNQTEREKFSKYMLGDLLTIEKELTYPRGKGSQKYYGKAMANPDFVRIRLANNAAEMKLNYNILVESKRFESLPPLGSKSSKDQIISNLDKWELNNLKSLERTRDNGQFFGFKEVGMARLEQSVRFLYVPAVADPKAESQDSKGTVIADLIDILVRNTLASNSEFSSLQDEFRVRMDGIVRSGYDNELDSLAIDLTTSMERFAPGNKVKLDWILPEEIDIPAPRTTVRIIEEGYPSLLETSGDGVQRAFLMAALQHLLQIQSIIKEKEEKVTVESIPEIRISGSKLPTMVLAIEEPELFQHPSRQRHIARILSHLTNLENNVDGSIQVIYTTHSPLMIDLERYDNIRLIRKIDKNPNEPKCAKVSCATMEEVTREMERVNDVPKGGFHEDSQMAKAQTLMTPWINEGFFSNVTVLVEGEEDRAILIGTAAARDIDFDALNISILPCGGKSQVLKAAVIFKALEIATYTIWDSDRDKEDSRPETNRSLLRAMNCEPEDYPLDKVESKYACFTNNFMATIQPEISEFEEFKNEAVTYYSLENWQMARKNPLVLSRILRNAFERSHQSSTADQILDAILERKNSAARGE